MNRRRDLHADEALIQIECSIERTSRAAFHQRLADVDFLISRLPPGTLHDDFVERRAELVERYTAYLLSTVPPKRRVA